MAGDLTCHVELAPPIFALYLFNGPHQAAHQVFVEPVGHPRPEEAPVHVRPRALPPAATLGRMHGVPGLHAPGQAARSNAATHIVGSFGQRMHWVHQGLLTTGAAQDDAVHRSRDQSWPVAGVLAQSFAATEASTGSNIRSCHEMHDGWICSRLT